MFPLGQNISDWVFAWNTSLLCWRRMDSVWSCCIHPLRARRGSSWPALTSHLEAAVCWAEPEVRRQEALGPGLAALASKSWSTCEMDRFTTGPHSCLFWHLLMVGSVEDHWIPVPCKTWLFFQVCVSSFIFSKIILQKSTQQ